MSPLSTFLLQAALFQVFLETILDHNSPQHIVAIQSITSYLLFVANVLNLKVRRDKSGRDSAEQCVVLVFGLKDAAQFALTICVV